MPPQHGESVLLTLFADVHYLFSPPGHRPPHSRFEKGSYVYLYHNPSTGQGRVEVANNAGTSHQDAFDGSLEYAHFRHTQRQPCLYAIEILRHPHVSQKQWQLKAFDQRHEREYMYPIQSLDIYFYTPDDSQEFTGALKRIHMLGGMDVEEAVQHSQRDSGAALSPVVQKFEHIAIHSPTIPNHPSPQQAINPNNNRSGSTSTAGSSFPGPPPPPPAQAQNAAGFAPMAYNPAAPAAPEPIAHREKTPPPEDPAQGNAPHEQANWANSVSYPRQNGMQYTQGQSQQQFAGQPQYAQSVSPAPTAGPTSPGFPPPPPGGATAAAAAAAPPAKNKVLPFQQYSQSFPAPSQPSSQFASPLQSPTNNGMFPQAPQSPGFAPPPAQPTPPPGGFSGYSYQPTQQAGSMSEAHSVHQQVYRPTEAEATKRMPAGEPAAAGPGQTAGRFEGRASQLEKGVNKWLKRLDKHL